MIFHCPLLDEDSTPVIKNVEAHWRTIIVQWNTNNLIATANVIQGVAGITASSFSGARASD